MIHYYKTPCHTDNLKLIREFVRVVLDGLHLSDTEANQIVLAVDEICTNIIFHSADNNPHKALEINIIEQDNELAFEIIDQSCEDVRQALHARPSLQNIVEERRKGGIGLLLVRNIMDEVAVSCEGNKNVWYLRKILHPHPQSAYK